MTMKLVSVRKESNFILKQNIELEMVKEYERKSKSNLLVYSAGKSTGMTNDALDRSSGRSVFYVTVARMKHTKITVKQLIPDDKVITTQSRTLCLLSHF